MSTKLHPGESKVFTTRVVGQTTLLSAFFLNPGDFGFVLWHKELCCEKWHSHPAPGIVDISAAGALVTVVNDPSNTADLYVRTDYI